MVETVTEPWVPMTPLPMPFSPHQTKRPKSKSPELNENRRHSTYPIELTRNCKDKRQKKGGHQKLSRFFF